MELYDMIWSWSELKLKYLNVHCLRGISDSKFLQTHFISHISEILQEQATFFFFRSIHSNFFTILIWTVVTPKLVLYDFRQKVFTFYFQDREYFQPRKTDEKWIQKWIRERKFQKTSENRGDSGVDDWSISGNVRYENSLSLLLAISLDRSHLFGHVLYNGSLMK